MEPIYSRHDLITALVSPYDADAVLCTFYFYEKHQGGSFQTALYIIDKVHMTKRLKCCVEHVKLKWLTKYHILEHTRALP